MVQTLAERRAWLAMKRQTCPYECVLQRTKMLHPVKDCEGRVPHMNIVMCPFPEFGEQYFLFANATDLADFKEVAKKEGWL